MSDFKELGASNEFEATVEMPNVTKALILEELGVSDEFDATVEIENRVNFLKRYAKESNAKVFVLGISGGIDSTTAAMLAMQACNELRTEGYDIKFIAVRLPYGVQKDEDEAQLALASINPDSVNIKSPADAMLGELCLTFDDDKHCDLVKGNIKARQRMIAQYAIAGTYRGLVIGTDHNAEAVMGFFTKFGDGACDIAPLTGLNKRRVRALGKFLGAPDVLVNKVPTADLEDLDPGRPDEHAYGVTYEQIDDFLEGKPIQPEAEESIIRQYMATTHKRSLPVVP
jgi:NAD+ synthase